MSVLENNSETYGNYVTGFPNDNMDNLLFGKKYNEKVTGDERTTRSIGWVAAGGYSYKYKYSFDFNTVSYTHLSESLLEDVLEDLSVNNDINNSVNTLNWENELEELSNRMQEPVNLNVATQMCIRDSSIFKRLL